MPDEGQHARVSHEGGRQRANGKAPMPSACQEPQGGGGVEQPRRAGFREPRVVRDLPGRPGAVAQVLEQVQLHAGQERLGVHEPRHDVEERLGAIPRDGPREGKAGGPALEIVPRHQRVPSVPDPLVPRGRRYVPGRTAGGGHGSGAGGTPPTIRGQGRWRRERLLRGSHRATLSSGYGSVKKTGQVRVREVSVYCDTRTDAVCQPVDMSTLCDILTRPWPSPILSLPSSVRTK